MQIPRPEWLIGGEPREVQLEALRRSYYGYELRHHKDGDEQFQQIRRGFVPAKGWGQLLEMRLGKTPLILNEAALFVRDWSFERAVIFSPNSYKEDWLLESEKYGLPIPAIAYEQSKIDKVRVEVAKAKGRCALIVNYEALIYDVTLDFLSEFIGTSTYVAADESIKLKNHAGLFFKGAMRVSKEAGVTRIATGLPITQGPQDWYSQARFIRQYDGKNYYAFRGKYCQMGGFKAKKIVGIKNELELTKDINGAAFVAKRKDWGKQTEAEWFTLKATPSKEQQRLYREIEQEFITWLEDGTEVSADQVTSKLMKMQQISSGFVYLEDGTAREIMDPRKTPKMSRLVEFIEEELVGKVIVPYHYSKSGDMLLEVLAQYNPAIIRGDEWMRKNGRDVVTEKARFNRDPSSRVIILQIAAGKYGHDLSGVAGDRCQTMVFFENTYSLDDRGQIEARNTTAFQDWSNLYFDMVSTPIEGKATKALARKESVVEAVLGAYRDNKKWA